nr:MAG TPA: hypothetical protein [Caudoviricetes sp.]
MFASRELCRQKNFANLHIKEPSDLICYICGNSPQPGFVLAIRRGANSYALCHLFLREALCLADFLDGSVHLFTSNYFSFQFTYCELHSLIITLQFVNVKRKFLFL